MLKKIYSLLCVSIFGATLALGHGFDVLVFKNASLTALDNTALAAIDNLGFVHNFSVASTDNPGDFNTANLATYEAVIFVNRNGDGFSAAEKSALETFIQGGNGFVGIYTAGNPTSGWTWFSDMIGTSIGGMAGSGSQAGLVKVADMVHPSGVDVPQEWTVTDTWYNLQSNPRGIVHVLATLDENSITGGTNGYDHPISWCQEYDGGRIWYTAMGATAGIYSDSDFQDHLVGAIEWAGGAEAGDAGVTIESNFDVTILDNNNTDPMELDVAPDGRVFFIEKTGAIKIWKPTTSTTVTAGVQPVFPGAENGMLGMALDPNFPTQPYIYLHYTFQDGNWANIGPGTQIVARFSVAGDVVNIASREILLTYIIDRDAEIHSGGSLAFDSAGNLYISTGDNTHYGKITVNPFAPIDERPTNVFNDAQRTSANTNDLRGKILRITPNYPIGSGYSIPAGNLFTASATRKAEIYIMGVRNPFRISIDPATNWLYWGDVGPDAVTADPLRGPVGKDEFNQAKAAGNFGWPYTRGNNTAYIDYDFATMTSGSAFDPNNMVNNSPNNTGDLNIPNAVSSLMWMDKATTTPEWPELGNGNATAMAGPVYQYNGGLASTGKFPEYYDKTLFIYDWTKNWIKEVKLDASGNVVKINPFLDGYNWLRPMDMKMGPDGYLYVLEWDLGWGGAGNTNSRITRIKYTPNDRPPIAVATSDVDNGPINLTVNFNGASSYDPVLALPLGYSWNFGDGSPVSTATNPTHTYTTSGDYEAILTVTNSTGKTATARINVAAGNTRPVVTVNAPARGGFFDWGANVPFSVEVTDAEDGSTTAATILCSSLNNQTLLGHDGHAHPSTLFQSCAGSFIPFSGHDPEDNIFFLFEGRYTDQGAPGVGSLTGSTVHLIHPKLKQAEHFSTLSGVELIATTDGSGRDDLSDIDDGDFISLTPMNLFQITQIRVRIASNVNGGIIEMRKGTSTGVLVATFNVPNTGSMTTYNTVTVNVADPGGTDEYFFVFKNASNPDDMMVLNWVEFVGTGVGSPALPVEVVDFEAKVVEDHFVGLSWATLYEQNSDYFSIERTASKIESPEEIAVVTAQGTSFLRVPYQVVDLEPLDGISYYRLVQYDLDGKQHFTRWHQVAFSRDPNHSSAYVYPNPAQSRLNIDLTVDHGKLLIELFDVNGASVLQQEFSTESHRMTHAEMDLSKCTNGVYYLRIQNEGNSHYRKVVVAR